MIAPEHLCQQHLLGEHVELHMLVGHLKKGRSVDGFVANNLIDTSQIQSRHEVIANEMLRRNLNHKSPLEYTHKHPVGYVGVDQSYLDLIDRCEACRQSINRRIYGYKGDK